MTHDEFVSEIHKLVLDYHVRVSTQIMANLNAAFGGDVPASPPKAKAKPPAARPYDVDAAFKESGPPFSEPKATTGTVKMSDAEIAKGVERMAKAEGMAVVPGAKVVSEGHDLHPLGRVLLSHIKMAPGIGSGALSRDTGIPGTTAREQLKRLVAANMIVKKTTPSKFGGVGVSYYLA